jgi:hypothetical protein
MKNEKNETEPSTVSLVEMPELDFSSAIRPNRYANLRGDFKQAVFIDRDLWEHFRSEERVLEALRLLIDVARRKTA